ncbi:MAG: FliM/FliN family flagellar motor switch protein [Pseudomonadota bacterium]
MDRVNPVLAKKLGLTPDAAKVTDEARNATPARQMRRALGRAADKAVALSASVLGFSEDEADAEDLVVRGLGGISGLEEDESDSPSAAPDCVVMGLRSDEAPGLTGLVLFDVALRSALVEVQTMGRLLPPAEEPRKVTRTDVVLCQSFAEHWIAELIEAGFDAGGAGLMDADLVPLDDLRTAGLVLKPGAYRLWRVSVQIGGGEIQGEAMLAVRSTVTDQQTQPSDATGWSAAMSAALGEAPADLEAVLGHLTLPLSHVDDFAVGQVVKLPGTTVGSVQIMAPGDQVVGTARLGQIAGKRAIRLEGVTLELSEAPPLTKANSPTSIAPEADTPPEA